MARDRLFRGGYATGGGAGFDTFQATQTALIQPTSTANLTLTGLSVTVTTPAATSIYLVTISADVEPVGGTTNIIELLVDGSALALQMLNSVTGLASSVAVRRSCAKTWRVTGLGAGSHTFTARTRNTGAATFCNVYDSFTQMTVQWTA